MKIVALAFSPTLNQIHLFYLKMQVRILDKNFNIFLFKEIPFNNFLLVFDNRVFDAISFARTSE